MLHIGITLLCLLAFVLLGIGCYVLHEFRWLWTKVNRDAYFTKTLANRLALREEIRQRARRLVPILSVAAQTLRLRPPSAAVHGIRFPLPNCAKVAVKKAFSFRPDARDILIVTQMRSGTTWMQQIVFEVLCRGEGSLADDGHRHMSALSPWLESCTSVPLERAPRIGERQNRIIKTHLPSDLCPFSHEARYIYVLRHPLSCFASTVDFIRMIYGPLSYRSNEFADWFCSERMWWGSWPDHAIGWWRRAMVCNNVLFIHYEEMLADLYGIVARIASFLQVDLTREEHAEVVRRSSFSYMKEREEYFEMAPPNFFSVGEGTFFKSGNLFRAFSVSDADRSRIIAYCSSRLSTSEYPVERFYPDLC
jgi:hypothetical protein